MRIGWGFDAHQFSAEGKVLLAGVLVEEQRGIDATSDGDVLAHAVTDSLLGAAALGDLGMFYPSSDSKWSGVDSMSILADAMIRVAELSLSPQQIDVTVISETVRISPYREEIRTSLATALGLDVVDVSVKATSTDLMGFLGRDEGLAVVATVVVS